MAAAFLEGASQVLAAHPVAVNLEKLDRAALATLRATPLEELRSLDVTKINAKQVTRFSARTCAGSSTSAAPPARLATAASNVSRASESHLRTLRRLALSNSEVGDPGLRARGAPCPRV